METVRDLDHETRWFGLRFVNRETERQYREWRIATAMPFARVGYIGSAPSWFLQLVAFPWVVPQADPLATPLIAGWVVLLVVLTALTFPESLRRSVMPLAALANCAAGFLIIVLLYDLISADLDPRSRAGVMTAGMFIVMFFGFAIFRIPPALCIAAVTPYVAFASYRLFDSYFSDVLGLAEVTALVTVQWIAYSGSLLVCIVIEIVSRRSFCKDQIIHVQQAELSRSRDAIRRYVPPAVAEHLVTGDLAGMDAPERRRVTVLFGDLVGFTTLADRVEAEVLTDVINDYISAMSQIVHDEGGTVTEFAGDGLMVLFGAPEEKPADEQVRSAVRAAQAMQARFRSLNDAWSRTGVNDPMAMRIGINTGVLSVGSFGSGGQVTYTAIGLQANVAARIQTHCEPGGILLSDASWHLVKDVVECEPRGEVECKGVHYPVRVHAPVDADPDDATQLEASGRWS